MMKRINDDDNEVNYNEVNYNEVNDDNISPPVFPPCTPSSSGPKLHTPDPGNPMMIIILMMMISNMMIVVVIMVMIMMTEDVDDSFQVVLKKHCKGRFADFSLQL